MCINTQAKNHIIKPMRKLFGTILLICTILSVIAQRYERYQTFDVQDGFSSNYVDCIYKDSRGFTWVGTWDGLNRYDGYDVVQYKADVQDSSMLMGNWIFKIFEDHQHNLWICTNNGLSRYNYEKDCFERKDNLSFISVKAIAQSKDCHLWLSTINGLIEYNYADSKIENRYFVRDSSDDENYTELSDLAFDVYDNLWIGTHSEGFFRFNTKTNEEIHYVFRPDNSPTISNKIKTMCFDNKGRLWIGSFDNGIAIFDTTEKTFNHKFYDANNPFTIGSNAVSHINTDLEGSVWVCCQNGYLNKYRYETDDFIRYEYNSYLSNSLPTKAVSCIFQDRLGVYWIGTHGFGVAQFNPVKNRFKLYRVLPNSEKSLPDNKVSAFLELPDGNIAIGTDGGGLAIFNRNTEEFETYGISDGLGSNAVIDLCLGNGSEIWMATWNGGIAKFDYRTKQITSYVHNPNTKNSLIYNNTKGICFNNDSVWIATHGEGIAIFDTRTLHFSSHLNSKNVPFNLKTPAWANDIYIDSKKRTWIATFYGLYCYSGGGLVTFINSSETPKALSSNQIISVFEDRSGTIWSISNNGLDIYNEKKGHFFPCDSSWDLPKSVKAIVADSNDNLWMSSGEGICRFSLRNHKKQMYTRDEGLPLNDYLNKSAYRLTDGTILIGGTNGFVSFNPEEIEPPKDTPNVEFINLYINNRLQNPSSEGSYIDKVIASADVFEYTYSHDIIAFTIAAFNITNPDVLYYSYLIDGYNTNWIQLEKSRKVILPTLSPGTYTLKVKANTKKDDGAESIRELSIIVVPQWWQTWWFKGLLCVAGALLLIALYLGRLKRLKRVNRVLERKVYSRTRELIQTNEALKEKQLVIEMKNDQLKEALGAKNQLISILAHDFKNPLNGILGASELLGRQSEVIQNLKIKKYIQIIRASANSLIDQMVKVLDWVQGQDSNIEASPVEINLETLLDDALALESGNAARKEIEIKRETRYNYNAFVDPKMINLVYRNILTNALKFTPKGGLVSITIEEEEDYITTSFADTGNGMSEQLIDTLLNTDDTIKSEYGTEKEKGTGLGLRLCKQFIQKNEGTMHIANAPKGGAVFTISLPKGESLASKSLSENETETLSKPENKRKEQRYSILIIDDDAEVIDSITETFDASYAVLQARDGKNGRELASRKLPDIIICDVNIPGMSGIEICSLLKKNPLTNHIPILLISSHSEEEIKNNAFRSGANDFIEKPFNPFYLKSKIESLLEYQKNLSDHMRLNATAIAPEAFHDATIRKTIEYINEHILDSSLNTFSVADEIGLSRTQLWRIFKQKTDRSLSDYIKDIKMQKAATMLMSGKYRVNEIAYMIGFSDTRYFSRIFSKEFGITPSEYAKKFKGRN